MFSPYVHNSQLIEDVLGDHLNTLPENAGIKILHSNQKCSIKPKQMPLKVKGAYITVRCDIYEKILAQLGKFGCQTAFGISREVYRYDKWDVDTGIKKD